ncbi:MAG: MBL fold metallo-hydrolase [Bryobacterales bacterium]|nr:MBL fold metallo-hydrolase [Bryobacterales bacterium]
MILKLSLLASGSSGNCAWVATEKTRLLVDAGLSFKEMERRLAGIGERPEKIDAVLITHEHSDHVGGLVPVARRLKIPVFATGATAAAVGWGEYRPHLEIFQAGSRFAVGDIEIDSFTLPHDAADPVGFCLRSQGIKVALVTDLGYITESIRYQLRGAHALVLEANHDLDMLKVGPYPWSVKQRVMSRMGHLSNAMACDFLAEDLDTETCTLIMAHLSESNNHPEIVRMSVAEVLTRRGLEPKMVVAQQRHATEAFTF